MKVSGIVTLTPFLVSLSQRLKVQTSAGVLQLLYVCTLHPYVQQSQTSCKSTGASPTGCTKNLIWFFIVYLIECANVLKKRSGIKVSSKIGNYTGTQAMLLLLSGIEPFFFFFFFGLVWLIFTICSVPGRATARQPNIRKIPQSSLYS